METEQKELSFNDFETMQKKLSTSIELLMEVKKFYTEIWAQDSNLKMEQMMTTEENAVFIKKLNEMQQQITSLGKRLENSRDHLMSNINVLTEHLARLERKNTGWTDKAKFWNKPKNVAEEINENNRKAQIAEPRLFSFNDE